MDPASPLSQKALSEYTPQIDASKYIRTYAKDVAQVTNTPIVGTPASTIIPAVSGTTTEAGVTVEEFDSSQINTAENSVSPKEFAQEEVTLSASDSEGIFVGQISDTPSSTAPTAAFSSLSLAPNPEIKNTITEPPKEPEEDREMVLARLRAKLASQQEEITRAQTVAPEPLIREAAPDFSTTPEPTLPQTPAIEVPAFVPPTPADALQGIPSPIHTYSSDFADHIDEQKSSTFSVLAAQSDADQSQVLIRSTRIKRSYAPLLVGVAMLIIGIGAVTGAYVVTRKPSSQPLGVTVPSLIRFDESVEIKGTGSELMAALSNVAQGGSVAGNVIVTYVTGPNATSTTGIPQQGGMLIKALTLAAPDILLRNIDETSTVGTIRAGSESRPFFILKVNSYERTFAGMLAWEQTMQEDIAILYPPYPSLAQITASTSPQSSAITSQSPVFTDAVVANHNVRIVRDDSGRSILLYGYRGKDILIIARDEAAFSELLSRVSLPGN